MRDINGDRGDGEDFGDEDGDDGDRRIDEDEGCE